MPKNKTAIQKFTAICYDIDMLNKRKISFSIVIIIAIIIFAVFLTRIINMAQNQNLDLSLYNGDNVKNKQPSVENVIPVNYNDHIRGNPQAPIKIIEYSDFQCPYCQNFHIVMQQIINDYPDKVQWIYRHFPDANAHPQAAAAAIVSECVAELSGNNAFWQAADVFFTQQNLLGMDFYKQIANELKINESKFNACLNSDKYAKKVEAHLQNALDSGATGTPYSVIILPDSRKVPLSGATSYEVLESVIK